MIMTWPKSFGLHVSGTNGHLRRWAKSKYMILLSKLTAKAGWT